MKIAIVLFNRANYARSKTLMIELANVKSVELQVICGASMLLEKYGKSYKQVEKDGFSIARKILSTFDGDSLASQTLTTGACLNALAHVFSDLEPHLVVTIADRYETIATAIAASYANIQLVHLQGGDISGNIDDKVRDAVSMLSDYHFPSSERSKRRLESLGITPERIFNYGCPSLDLIKKDWNDTDILRLANYGGTGSKLELNSPFILVCFHPVTTSFGKSGEDVAVLLASLMEFKTFRKIILWPNPDAGTDDVSKTYRIFRESNHDHSFSFFKNFSPEDYSILLSMTSCAVGNSSSFIREGAFLGTPAVIVGDRQVGRETGNNVLLTSIDRDAIVEAISRQVAHGRYEEDHRFGQGKSGSLIASKIIELFKNGESNSRYSNH